MGEGWRVPRTPPHPRKTPQPIAGFRQKVSLRNPDAAALPRSYVLFSANTLPHAPVMRQMAGRAREAGWRFIDLPHDHIAPETHPDEVAALLEGMVKGER